MKFILLSGNTDKRLWPLSGDVNAKQFMKIFKNSDGEYESMIQRIVANLKDKCSDSDIIITSKKNQISTIKSQVGDDNLVVCEPELKGTFAASLLTSLYLNEVNNVDMDEIVAILPVDMFVEEYYFNVLSKLDSIFEKSNNDLVLIGTKPTYSSVKYGYILTNGNNLYDDLDRFVNKVSEEEANDLISKGALWNCGVFACRLRNIIDIGHKVYEFSDYYDLYNKYNELEKSSLDDKLISNIKSIGVIRYEGKWKDIGTWNTLTESMDENIVGNVVLDESCNNTHIINELDIPILGMGLKDIVVAASPSGILISNKKDSSYIMPYVENFDNKVMYAEKSWGSFKVVDVQDESMTLAITLKEGNKMQYHSHDFRDEVWTIVSGTGKTVVDGMEQIVKPGDVVTIQAGCKHTIIAETDLKVIEVQIGKEINVNDKHKYKFED